MPIQAPTYTEVIHQMQNKASGFNDHQLFHIEVDRDKIWEIYLSNFPEDIRQEHNCNCCKSFLRQYSGLCAIIENKVVSIWDDLELPPVFKTVTDAMAAYIHSLPISDVFLADTQKLGTRQNFDNKRQLTWSHLFLDVPAKYKVRKDSIPTTKAEKRDNKNVLKRSLDELTMDATETVLELIGQNSLYRGKEFESLLKSFVLLQRQYKNLSEAERDALCWSRAVQGGAVCRIRNTSIGTLLIDLSNGLELDQAVAKFEAVVAPANYKRPTALVTPKMIEQAKATLAELGLLESLDRRYARETDLRACDVLFQDRPKVLSDLFDKMAKDTQVNPKMFSKIEEISIEDFISNIVPTAKTIEVLVENKHQANFVSLLTGPEPSLFKWDNCFSWSYAGQVTDSIKERVKAAGGNVQGELRASLSWSNYDDLDIHVHEPQNNNPIYFGNRRSPTTGTLDVDMNANGSRSREPVENVIWTDKNRMRKGEYAIVVNQFCKRETQDQGFQIQIECQGETYDFHWPDNLKQGQSLVVCKFTWDETGVKFVDGVDSKPNSREKWGVKSNQFHKVTKFLLSPNHWDKPTGNKHYMFMLEGCKSDEAPRPFFNEFLKQELDQHRKVLEVAGSKVKVEDDVNQLSGIGFSETVRNSVVVRVTGQFVRNIRVVV